MRYFDISPKISHQIAVYPGDVPFSREVGMAFEKGDNLLLSSIRTTLHLGSHADAPNHYHARGTDIASRSLDYYLGRCQVVRVRPKSGQRLYPEDLKGIPILEKRILFHTGSFPDPDRWRGGFHALSPQLIEDLADRGAVLVGIDTPSVDPETSKALESHQAIYRRDLAILEGLVLDRVPEGCYILIALPLKIEGADASPVRAVLLPTDCTFE